MAQPTPTPTAGEPKPNLLTNLKNFFTGQGGPPANPDAELDYIEDRHLLLLEQKRRRLRAWVAGELARVEAGEERPTVAAPERRGRIRGGK